MTDITLTEKSVSDKLLDIARLNGVKAPRVVVVSREQVQKRSISRKVRFVLIVNSNNEKLIDNLVLSSLDNDNLFSFVGSDVNLQSDMEMDYLFVEAIIFAKTGD